MRLIDVYHRLPYGGRCLAAGLRGATLRWWRTSAETPRLVEEALERERWGAGEWRRFQDDALAAVLDRAARRVPYYRRTWRGRTAAEWRVLANWPILTKEEVRRAPRAFLADDRDPRRMLVERTSGSTGTPLVLWRSRATSVRWYALVEARLRAWNGVSRREPWAMLGGRVVAPADRRRPPYWVWNRPMRQLYMSIYHLEPGAARDYLDAIERHRARYLIGFASAMAELARLAEAEGAAPAPLAVAINNAEPLHPYQRRVIERVFGPVRDSYGTAELSSAASECAHGALHLWPEVGVVEVLADDAAEPVPAGATGRLITTGLLNPDMPLVRYQVGDRAALRPAGEACACGRGLPVLQALEGRDDDVVVTPAGRRVGRLDSVFRGDLPIRGAQVAQVGRDRVVLRVVPAPGYGPAVADRLADALRRRLGSAMRIDVDVVERLPRTAAGKLRAVVSELQGDN